MRKIYPIFLLFVLPFILQAQNVGINQPNPTHSLHISPVTLGDDPLRIDGVQTYSIGDTALLMLNPTTGIVKYINPADFVSLISGGAGLGTDNQNIDSLILNGLTLTTFIENGSSASVDLAPLMDSITTLLYDNADTLLNNTTFINALRDSIDTDVDSVTLVGTTLTIYENGNSVFVDLASLSDADSDPENEIQDLNLTGDDLTITNNSNPTTVDLSPYLDNTDAQNLTLTGNVLSISNGNSVTFTDSINDADSDPNNEIELPTGGNSGEILSTDGNGNYSWVPHGVGTDNQDLSLTGDSLSLTNDSSPVDLSGYLDNTDAQNLTLTGNVLSISNGNSVTLTDSVNDADSDPNNEIELPTGGSNGQILSTDGNGNYTWITDGSGSDNQDLSLTGNSLSLTNDGTPVDLSGYLDNTDTQNLTLTGNVLSISNGNSVTLADSVNDADSDPNNEIQSISKSGSTVTLSNGGGSFTDEDTQLTEAQVDAFVNNNGYLTSFTEVDSSVTNEIQNLSLNGNTLSISNGNNVSLSAYNGDITDVNAGVGLTGGGSSGGITINASANNGIGINSIADKIQLGGALIQNTTITQGDFEMVFNLSGTGDFIVQDAGISHFQITDNGETYFGGNTYWRDENIGGTNLMSFMDDGDDGRLRIYENGITSIDLDANSHFIFNEQGLDRDFRVEADGDPDMLFVDASSDRVGLGVSTPTSTLDVDGDARIRNLPNYNVTTDTLIVIGDSQGNLHRISLNTLAELLVNNYGVGIPQPNYPSGTVHCGTPTVVVDVLNPATGKTWMDRNLGANQVATSSTDAQAYGDLYQWGRSADGHQCRNSGATSTNANSDTPGHGDFILEPSSPNDWRTPQNNNLWQGVNGINNPCPSGYRIPTEAELDAERLSWTGGNNNLGAFASPLKLPATGYRGLASGSLNNVGSSGNYWSSSVSGTRSRYLNFFSGNALVSTINRANGFSVRCIKNTRPNSPSVSTLNCSGANTSGTLTQGQAASNVSTTINYTGGNGATYSSSSVTSSGVSGLTATLTAGTLTNGSGTITYSITGTPSSSGTATFSISFGGISCSFSIGVATQSPAYPSGTVHCGTSTAVVDVLNPTTGKTWMDRNLGASQVATSSTDAQAYGDFYQWGRPADGHQCRNSGTTNSNSNSNTPNHNNFILESNSPYDWRTPQNNTLWQGANGTNNPCPSGYRIPTETELNAERLSWTGGNNSAGAYNSPLKLPAAGYRLRSNGTIYEIGVYGYYWASTINVSSARFVYFNSLFANMGSNYRAFGFSVRCIKGN